MADGHNTHSAVTQMQHLSLDDNASSNGNSKDISKGKTKPTAIIVRFAGKRARIYLCASLQCYSRTFRNPISSHLVFSLIHNEFS